MTGESGTGHQSNPTTGRVCNPRHSSSGSCRDLPAAANNVPPPATIRTRRLVVSPIAESDEEDLQRAASRPEVADTMISIPHPYPEGEASRYIGRHLDEARGGSSVAYVIRKRRREGHERECENSDDPRECKSGIEGPSPFVGVVEIRAVDAEHLLAELSFWLAVDAWGNGYMTEAVAAVVDYAFSSTSTSKSSKSSSFLPRNLNRLYAYHMVRNPACGVLLKRNGFAQEGILRDRVRKHDRFEDVAICAVLRRDWESRRRGQSGAA